MASKEKDTGNPVKFTVDVRLEGLEKASIGTARSSPLHVTRFARACAAPYSVRDGCKMNPKGPAVCHGS